MVLRWWADGVTQLPNNWLRSSPLDATVVYAGTAVAAVWVSQAVAGCWRPTADWIDRLGRFLGFLWILSGFVFAVRLVLWYADRGQANWYGHEPRRYAPSAKSGSPVNRGGPWLDDPRLILCLVRG